MGWSMRRRLRIERLRRWLTQKDIAERIGLEVHYYGQIELGHADGAPGVWERLEELLGVPKEALMEDTEGGNEVLIRSRSRGARNDV